jgi:hypothetical protein
MRDEATAGTVDYRRPIALSDFTAAKKPRTPGSGLLQTTRTILPFLSMSMRSAAGADESPGMVRMSPQMG